MNANRILQHPILGPLPRADTLTFFVDGRPVEARAGETIAAALVAAGWKAFRRTEKRHAPRGVFCAIGKCTDCVMTVDGTPNVRTCVTLVRENMQIKTQDGLGEWPVA
ncbi:MAG: (2Fe-2S)-binding protein [Kiritimatiellae bacterium]|nr:(2Fe-2S)-binding protein [Kiritimatiellia bacterium]